MYIKILYTNVIDNLVYKILQNNPEGKIYRLVIEGLSEVLNKMAKTLSELDLQSNELHTWDFFKKGDVHQLMILLEHYPRETISLIFLLTEIDPETMQPYTIKHFRKNWCTSHPKLGFWGQPNATHFLREICSFDFDELLRTLSSDELLVNSNKLIYNFNILSLKLTLNFHMFYFKLGCSNWSDRRIEKGNTSFEVNIPIPRSNYTAEV